MIRSNGAEVNKLPDPVNIPNNSEIIKMSLGESTGRNNRIYLSASNAKEVKNSAIMNNPTNVYILISRTLYVSKVMLECNTRLYITEITASKYNASKMIPPEIKTCLTIFFLY